MSEGRVGGGACDHRPPPGPWLAVRVSPVWPGSGNRAWSGYQPLPEPIALRRVATTLGRVLRGADRYA